MTKLKPCPFCGGKDIRQSIKITGRFDVAYHVAYFCSDCHCYGARILTPKVRHNDYKGRASIETNERYRELAAEAWNRRVENATD